MRRAGGNGEVDDTPRSFGKDVHLPLKGREPIRRPHYYLSVTHGQYVLCQTYLLTYLLIEHSVSVTAHRTRGWSALVIWATQTY